MGATAGQTLSLWQTGFRGCFMVHHPLVLCLAPALHNVHLKLGASGEGRVQSKDSSKVHTRTHTYAHKYTRVHAHTHVRACVRTHEYAHTRARTHTHAHPQTQTHTHPQTHTHRFSSIFINYHKTQLIVVKASCVYVFRHTFCLLHVSVIYFSALSASPVLISKRKKKGKSNEI